MSRYRPCPQCQRVMVLEDHGELLETVDVLSFFEYRCRACGHLERSDKGSLLDEDEGSTRRPESDPIPLVAIESPL